MLWSVRIEEPSRWNWEFVSTIKGASKWTVNCVERFEPKFLFLQVLCGYFFLCLEIGDFSFKIQKSVIKINLHFNSNVSIKCLSQNWIQIYIENTSLVWFITNLTDSLRICLTPILIQWWNSIHHFRLHFFDNFVGTLNTE